MKQFLSLMLAAVAGGVIAFSAPGSRAEEKKEPDSLFGSLLTLRIQGACVVETADKLHVTLDNPTVRVLGERAFLVGPQVDDDQKLKRDLTKIRYGEDAALWIPVDAITVIGQISMDE
jgi:hypothetical protein